MYIGDAPEKKKTSVDITVPFSGYVAISQMSLSFRISIHNPTWDIKNLPYKYKGCRWLQTYFIIMSEISVLLAHAEQAVSNEYHLSMSLLQKLDNYFTGIWRTHQSRSLSGKLTTKTLENDWSYTFEMLYIKHLKLYIKNEQNHLGSFVAIPLNQSENVWVGRGGGGGHLRM